MVTGTFLYWFPRVVTKSWLFSSLKQASKCPNMITILVIKRTYVQYTHNREMNLLAIMSTHQTNTSLTGAWICNEFPYVKSLKQRPSGSRYSEFHGVRGSDHLTRGRGLSPRETRVLTTSGRSMFELLSYALP